MALLDLSYFIVAMANSDLVDERGCNYENCLAFIGLGNDEDEIRLFIGFTKAYSCVIWIGASVLLVYEYRKGLSESWYSFKLFWTLTAIMNI